MARQGPDLVSGVACSGFEMVAPEQVSRQRLNQAAHNHSQLLSFLGKGYIETAVSGGPLK
jgi:hypothetical protein